MNILLFSLSKIMSSSGGITKAYAELANALVEHGHYVTAVYTDNSVSASFFKFNRKINFYNLGLRYKNNCRIKLYALLSGTLQKKHKIKYYGYGHILAPKIERIIQSDKPDIIICFQPRAALIIKNILHCTIPTILSCHRRPEEILEDNQGLNILEKCDVIHTLSPSQAKIIASSIHNRRIVSIGNAAPEYTEKIISYQTRKIINVASFSEDKNQLLLIEAFNKVSRDNPTWTLEFWGSTTIHSSYYKKCVRLVKKHGLTSKISFRGITSHVSQKLSDSSIFAFPSMYESFPLSLMEAMSIGLPTIGLRSCTGVNELIEDNINGFLCENNINHFASQLTRLMNDELLRKSFGISAKKSMQKYSRENVWHQWESLLDSLL